jgi:hypothetical protein
MVCTASVRTSGWRESFRVLPKADVSSPSNGLGAIAKLQQWSLVYDLIAKIYPESDSIYDLTAIDNKRSWLHEQSQQATGRPQVSAQKLEALALARGLGKRGQLRHLESLARPRKTSTEKSRKIISKFTSRRRLC